MATHFMKAFQTDQGSFTFYFNRLHTHEGVRYHVSTIARNKKVIIFHMAPRENNWKLINPTKIDWLDELEPHLSDTIKQNVNG